MDGGYEENATEEFQVSNPVSLRSIIYNSKLLGVISLYFVPFFNHVDCNNALGIKLRLSL